MKTVTKVIQFPDVLDNVEATRFRREISHIIEAGVSVILVDLQRAKTMTSPGLIALVSAFRAVQAAGGKLVICSVSEQTRMLFELTGVDQVFEVCESLDEFHQATKVPALLH